MKTVLLKDGTRIEGCLSGTTSNEVIVLRDSYGAAGSVMDVVNADNASVIKVYDEEGQLETEGFDLILNTDAKLTKVSDGITITFTTRNKTDLEKMQDEIEELQEAVIGE